MVGARQRAGEPAAAHYAVRGQAEPLRDDSATQQGGEAGAIVSMTIVSTAMVSTLEHSHSEYSIVSTAEEQY